MHCMTRIDAQKGQGIANMRGRPAGLPVDFLSEVPGLHSCKQWEAPGPRANVAGEPEMQALYAEAQALQQRSAKTHAAEAAQWTAALLDPAQALAARDVLRQSDSMPS